MNVPQENPIVEYYSPEEKVLIQRAYRNLLRSVSVELNNEDKVVIRKAYKLAVEAHAPQRRKTGEAYIFHPIEVARICAAEIELGTTAIAAALLHDVVEDTPITLQEIKEQFGDKIAQIVDGLTKLDRAYDRETIKLDTFVKVLATLTKDVRVILIKMADRLHNMRTIGGQPRDRQLAIAHETEYIYSPVAHRLGLYQIKTEFQDLCMKVASPEEYQDIKHQLKETKRDRDRYINDFIKPIIPLMDELAVPYRIFGRPKSIYSIWNKIKDKDVAFEDIYDLFAIRIVIDVPVRRERGCCWQAYSIVTDIYKPISDRLKDWISNPKSNGYESLHTTVLGPDRRFVEVQIRTERMNAIAELGYAAHWKYKNAMSDATGATATITKKDSYVGWFDNIREILETNTNNAMEFLDDFTNNLSKEEISVYTPKGEERIFPKGATALDFAFDIHSKVGSECSSIKIGNRLVPMNYKLKNGDQVTVSTNKNQKPTEDWLKMVITSKAIGRIRTALKEEMKLKGSSGKETLERKLAQLKVDFEENCDMLVKYFGFNNRLDFFFAISLEQVHLSDIRKLKVEGQKLVAPEIVREESKAAATEARSVHKVLDTKPRLFINGESADHIKWDLATCCNPLPGDEVFAYTTVSGMKIHRYTCLNAPNLSVNYSYRIKRAEWGNTPRSSFVAMILITGIDTGVGVIERLSHNISTKLGLNIRSFNIEGNGGYFECRLGLVVTNTDQLHLATAGLKLLEGVNSVTRLDQA